MLMTTMARCMGLAPIAEPLVIPADFELSTTTPEVDAQTALSIVQAGLPSVDDRTMLWPPGTRRVRLRTL